MNAIGARTHRELVSAGDRAFSAGGDLECLEDGERGWGQPRDEGRRRFNERDHPDLQRN